MMNPPVPTKTLKTHLLPLVRSLILRSRGRKWTPAKIPVGHGNDACWVDVHESVVKRRLSIDSLGRPASVELRYLEALHRAGFVVDDDILTISDSDGEPLQIVIATEESDRIEAVAADPPPAH